MPNSVVEKNKIHSFFEGLSPSLQNFLPRFILFLCLFGLFLFPIIHANFNYNDDWYHISSPVKVMHDGRPVQQFVLWFFSGFATTDIAPIFQILGTIFAAAGTALASIALNYTILSGTLALSFLFCNEFFLENLSYRFESIGMGLALGLTLAAFYIPIALKGKKTSLRWWGVVGVLILAWGSYQPPLNLYGGLSCLTAIMGILKRETLREVWQLFLMRMGAFAVSLVIYRLIIAIIPAFHDVYASEHSGVAHNIGQILSNFQQIAQFFFLLIEPWQNGLCDYGTFLLIFITLALIAFLYQVFLLCKTERCASKLISLCCFFIGIFLFFAGPMLLLASPVLTPRVMCGISIILTAAATFLINAPFPKIFQKISTIYISYLLYTALIASAAYGNASHILERYRLALDAQMRDDITHYYYSPAKTYFKDHGYNMQFVMVGDKGRFRPEAVQYIQNKYPIFQKIFIQKATWSTVFPAMGWDIMRINLIGGGHYKDHELPFMNPFWDLNPDAQIVRDTILDKVNHCQVNDIQKHSIFFTYRIGSYVVFDYDQRCNAPAKPQKINDDIEQYQNAIRSLHKEKTLRFSLPPLLFEDKRNLCLSSHPYKDYNDPLIWMGTVKNDSLPPKNHFSDTHINIKEALLSCRADNLYL